MTAPNRIAYLINQYPQVSHTFIRREIRALEGQGITIDRIALRGWDAEVVDADDVTEQEKTRYVLKDGVAGLLKDVLRMAVNRPGALFRALGAALSMSKGAIRPLPYHLIWLAEACRIVRWMESNGAHHLHAHFGTNPAEVARLVHLLSGRSYSFTIHGQDEIEGAKQLHFPAKVGDAAFVVAISAYCRSQILREIPHSEWSKLKVVHCGLDQAYFDTEAPEVPAHPQFLSVARLSPEKGHLVLLDAFAVVRGAYPEARLILAGDGPMRPELTSRIAALGLEDAVTITGWVDAARVKSELADCIALVQPSFIEGLPVVIMEAMARKRPVISTYVAGIPELVQPERTGWLVPAGDSVSLAEAMQSALSAGTETLNAYGMAGFERAKARHLIDTEAAKLKALFQEYGG